MSNSEVSNRECTKCSLRISPSIENLFLSGGGLCIMRAAVDKVLVSIEYY